MNSTEMEAIREFVIARIAKRKEHREIGIQDDLITSGIVDSLGIMHLVGFLENRFGIRIRDEDFMPENFSSVEAIASFVARNH
ncbi:MAG: acyl carrier protein [Deltaproteobacteria bacterium]|nr:acyl carrier protein [Deltaproteobacteria bacterium]